MSFTSGSHRLSAKAFDAAGNAGIDDDTTVTIDRNLLVLEETFSDKDSNGDLFDKAGWTANGWEASPDNHTVSPAGSRSAFASSGIRCVRGKKTRSLSKRIVLGASPRLSYFRKLDLWAAVNISTVASFKVLVNDTVVDEKSVVGANYTESSWTVRSNIDLSTFANQTVILTFEVGANRTSVSRSQPRLGSVTSPWVSCNGSPYGLLRPRRAWEENCFYFILPRANPMMKCWRC
jgi:hypothetical protein